MKVVDGYVEVRSDFFRQSVKIVTEDLPSERFSMIQTLDVCRYVELYRHSEYRIVLTVTGIVESSAYAMRWYHIDSCMLSNVCGGESSEHFRASRLDFFDARSCPWALPKFSLIDLADRSGTLLL